MRGRGAGDGRQEGAGEYTGAGARPRAASGTGRRQLQPGSASTAARPGAAGRPRQHVREGRASRRRPLLLHPRPDDFQSYAVTPAECVAHWLADSVEILIDPRGNASQTNSRHGERRSSSASSRSRTTRRTPTATASTARAGSATPTTTRATRPGRSRRRSTTPRTRPACRSSRRRRGSAATTTTVDHAYGAAGGYNLEVKIPLADLRRRSGRRSPPTGTRRRTRSTRAPGLNITPYDEDNTAAAGTTTLRHIDQSTRLAWSTSSAASSPIRSAGATRTCPATRRRRAARRRRRRRTCRTRTSTASHSPQTIYQSARTACRSPAAMPAPASDSIARRRTPALAASAVDVRHRRHRARARAHVFLWAGDHGAIPVFTDELLARRPTRRPTTGFSACAIDRRRHPAVVARHERPRDPVARRADRRRGRRRTSRSRSTRPRTRRWRRAARRWSRSRRRTTRCRRSRST